MKRSIVQQGPTTLMVSLPIKWVRKYALVKGGELNIEEQARRLIISTDEKEKESKIDIEINVLDKVYIWRSLQAAYISGYDEIIIHFEDRRILDIAQGFVISSLIGFEIVKQEAKFCIIKAVSTELETQFSPLLRQVFLNILQMSEITENFLNKQEDLSSILNLEITNNRHTMFLKRVLSKEGYEDQKKTSFVYSLVLLLEKIANEYKYLSWYVRDSKKIKLSRSVLLLYRELHEEIRYVYENFYTFDDQKAQEIIIEGINVEKMKEIFKQDAEIAHYFMKITDLIRTCFFQIMIIRS